MNFFQLSQLHFTCMNKRIDIPAKGLDMALSKNKIISLTIYYTVSKHKLRN